MLSAARTSTSKSGAAGRRRSRPHSRRKGFLQPPLAGPTPPERDQPTRPGKGGDLLKAALATQEGKRLVELAKVEAAKIPVGGKLAIGVLAASAAIGISTDLAARKTVLDTIDG